MGCGITFPGSGQLPKQFSVRLSVCLTVRPYEGRAGGLLKLSPSVPPWPSQQQQQQGARESISQPYTLDGLSVPLRTFDYLILNSKDQLVNSRFIVSGAILNSASQEQHQTSSYSQKTGIYLNPVFVHMFFGLFDSQTIRDSALPYLSLCSLVCDKSGLVHGLIELLAPLSFLLGRGFSTASQDTIGGGLRSTRRQGRVEK